MADVYIIVRKTMEFEFHGDHTELPAKLRRGVLVGKGDDRDVDTAELEENLNANDGKGWDTLEALSDAGDVEWEIVEAGME